MGSAKWFPPKTFLTIARPSQEAPTKLPLVDLVSAIEIFRQKKSEEKSFEFLSTKFSFSNFVPSRSRLAEGSESFYLE